MGNSSLGTGTRSGLALGQLTCYISKVSIFSYYFRILSCDSSKICDNNLGNSWLSNNLGNSWLSTSESMKQERDQLLFHESDSQVCSVN